MRRYTINVNGTEHVIDVDEISNDQFEVHIEGQSLLVGMVDHHDMTRTEIAPTMQVGRTAPAVASAPVARDIPAAETTQAPAATGRPAQPSGTPSARPAAVGGAAAANLMTAPMPGVVLTISATVGASVKRGESLMVLEAMKMKNDLRAARDGVIAEILVSAGDSVKYGDALVRFDGAGA